MPRSPNAVNALFARKAQYMRFASRALIGNGFISSLIIPPNTCFGLA
jgi:hypothetical protein